MLPSSGHKPFVPPRLAEEDESKMTDLTEPTSPPRVNQLSSDSNSIVSPLRRLARVAETQAQCDLDEVVLAGKRMDARVETANLAASCVSALKACQGVEEKPDTMAIEINENSTFAWLYLLLMVVYKNSLRQQTSPQTVQEKYTQARSDYTGAADDCGSLGVYLKSIWPEQHELWPILSMQKSLDRVSMSLRVKTRKSTSINKLDSMTKPAEMWAFYKSALSSSMRSNSPVSSSVLKRLEFAMDEFAAHYSKTTNPAAVGMVHVIPFRKATGEMIFKAISQEQDVSTSFGGRKNGGLCEIYRETAKVLALTPASAASLMVLRGRGPAQAFNDLTVRVLQACNQQALEEKSERGLRLRDLPGRVHLRSSSCSSKASSSPPSSRSSSAGPIPVENPDRGSDEMKMLSGSEKLCCCEVNCPSCNCKASQLLYFPHTGCDAFAVVQRRPALQGCASASLRCRWQSRRKHCKLQISGIVPPLLPPPGPPAAGPPRLPPSGEDNSSRNRSPARRPC
ncbi:unnamed protein product [Symbiodinium natans]|uniref:Uncharacterized protein n=1 Tax=Symbiodinium natans TaxID=878477 RepID=A0A812M0S0_9DINO|nr:unnamed protein product [Symbiodinium natans]